MMRFYEDYGFFAGLFVFALMFVASIGGHSSYSRLPEAFSANPRPKLCA